jgi:peptidoglycan hydrolase-like protein with peptidoglycan-binding domain
MTLTMYDSTTVADIPATGMAAVAGYVGGHWPTFAALVARFPNIPALSIAVNSSQDAQCLDIENGDASPADVPAWLDRQAQAHPGRTPILYTSASQIPAVRAAAGSRNYLLWSAHYGKGPHICGSCGFQSADATQWADTGPNGEHVDQTLMTPSFLAAFAPQAASPIPPIFANPVNHNTGLASEKPWGAFPLAAVEWYGVNDGTPRSHSGVRPQDQRGVKQIQREVGVTADGAFGKQTEAALIRWQQAHGLTADGRAGIRTWNAMTKA